MIPLHHTSKQNYFTSYFIELVTFRLNPPDSIPEFLRVNHVQAGPIRQPVCLSFGTPHYRRTVCLEGHSNRSCSKKGGETFVVVSPCNTKIHKAMFKGGRYYLVSQSCFSSAAVKRNYSRFQNCPDQQNLLLTSCGATITQHYIPLLSWVAHFQIIYLIGFNTTENHRKYRSA